MGRSRRVVIIRAAAPGATNDLRPKEVGTAPRGAAEQLYDKAKEATDYVADRASDLWDDTYDQGRRYYREGNRAMGDIDGGKVATALVAAALGYALAYLIHAQSISRRVPDYARVRGDYGRDYRGHSQR